jgi:hypothetical protein
VANGYGFAPVQTNCRMIGVPASGEIMCSILIVAA